MTARCRLTVLMALIATLSGNASAEPLGRLFFTPEHRATLDRLHQLERTGQTTGGATARLDGIAARSGGTATVWINGHAQQGNNLMVAATGHVALATGKETPTSLRVGEALDRATRRTSDIVTPGAIRVGSVAAQPH